VKTREEIERAQRHFREVFRRAMGTGDREGALVCGLIHDALGWAAGDDQPIDGRLPVFKNLIAQLDSVEGNTPN
jgi:hypothetical protein